jgi:hypothetical protein
VQKQGPARSVELNRVPGYAALRRFLLRRKRIDPSVDFADGRIGLAQLLLQILVVQSRLAKLDAFGVQAHLQLLRSRTLRRDALLERRPARRRASREQRCSENQTNGPVKRETLHVRK